MRLKLPWVEKYIAYLLMLCKSATGSKSVSNAKIISTIRRIPHPIKITFLVFLSLNSNLDFALIFLQPLSEV